MPRRTTPPFRARFDRFWRSRGNRTTLCIAGATALFVLRVCLFAGTYGGVEHDSGWFLGVARTLAERGLYASFTNTIPDPRSSVAGSIHNRPGVQYANGFSPFQAGVTVGPGYVVPEAIILRIFGDGFWQYRAWPLIGFAGLLVLLFALAWELGGAWAFLVLAAWLWCVPQLYLPFAYEAFSEHIGVSYFLAGTVLCSRAWKKNAFEKRRLWAAGILFGLACLTKTILLLCAAGAFAALLCAPLFGRFRRSAAAAALLRLLGGFLLPQLLFEAYRFDALVLEFNATPYPGVGLLLPLLLGAGIALAAAWHSKKRLAGASSGISLLVGIGLGALLVLLLGALLPAAWRWDWGAWNAIREERRIIFVTAGGGADRLADIVQSMTSAWMQTHNPLQALVAGPARLDGSFFAKKLAVWSDIGIGSAVNLATNAVLWAVFLAIPAFAIFFRRPKGTRRNPLLLSMLWSAALVSFAWYLLLSPPGYTRYAWAALTIGMLCLAIVLGQAIDAAAAGFRRWTALGFLAIVFLLIHASVFHPELFFSPRSVEALYAHRMDRGIESLPALPIFPLADQEGLVTASRQLVRPSDRVYYLQGLLCSEGSALIGKVFYPYQRYLNLAQRNPDGGRSLLIICPYQRGALAGGSEGPPDMQTLCADVLYENPSYLLCTLR